MKFHLHNKRPVSIARDPLQAAHQNPDTSDPGGLSRRDFIRCAVAATVLTGFSRQGFAQTPGEMPLRELGSTGEKVSIVGVGGHHIGRPRDENLGIRIVRSAIDGGINFMDNCWDYNEGQSEIRMGKALRDGYRERVFLMTKIDGRTRDSAARQIDESLRRFQTDHVDLLQFHEVIRLVDAERIFATGGAMEAVLAAKQAGKTRFIGFTGHKDPSIHLHMLQTATEHGFRFDAVQMPLNVMDVHYRSFQQRVLPELVRQRIGVIGMKSMGDGIILKSGVITAPECLRYAMSLQTSTVVTGMESMEILQQALDAAKDFSPMTEEEMGALQATTSRIGNSGRYELFKTRDRFDSTAHNPQWLG